MGSLQLNDSSINDLSTRDNTGDKISHDSLERKIEISLKPRPDVAAFLTKLYNMVNDKGSNSLIKWCEDGMSFTVSQPEEFSQEVLPKFFKHSNFSSFVRQLNMYGFHKVPHVLSGIKSDSADYIEFKHDNFQRGRPELLPLLKRRTNKSNPHDEGGGNLHSLIASGNNSELSDIRSLLSELTSIRQTQQNISQEMQMLRDQNSALWKEAMHQQERHKTQEETIDKILRFLASVYSSEKIQSLKSGMGPLSLAKNDGPSPNKKPKLISNDDSYRHEKNSTVSEFNASADNGIMLPDGIDDEVSQKGKQDFLTPAYVKNQLNGLIDMTNSNINPASSIKTISNGGHAKDTLGSLSNNKRKHSDNHSLTSIDNTLNSTISTTNDYLNLEERHDNLSQNIDDLELKVDDVTNSLGLSDAEIKQLDTLDVDKFLDKYLVWDDNSPGANATQ